MDSEHPFQLSDFEGVIDLFEFFARLNSRPTFVTIKQVWHWQTVLALADRFCLAIAAGPPVPEGATQSFGPADAPARKLEIDLLRGRRLLQTIGRGPQRVLRAGFR
jgi:hypothetical protein